jgi:hypothetical protein
MTRDPQRTWSRLLGGGSVLGHLWRFIARVSRDLEATAYRRLRALEERRTRGRNRAPRPS